MSVRKCLVRVAMFAILVTPMTVLAQDQGGGGGGNNGGGRQRDNAGGGGGRMDPGQWRERRMNEIKEQMGATDDEWQVLAPKVEKVMTAQREIMSAAFGGRGFGRGPGGGGPGGPGGGGDQPQTPVVKAASELRTVLENKDASADQINEKLGALRAARKQAQADLEAAQKDLKEVLTPRQEAVLVSRSMLD
jgi:hypothetical protein